MEIYFSIREIGAAGVASIFTAGTFMYTKDAADDFQGINFSTANNTTFDTTIDNRENALDKKYKITTQLM